jgi:FlaA1/EpsC-like NDP-sugar epimerase
LLEGLLTFLFVGGIRFSFRVSRRGHARVLSEPVGESQRVLIIGAGDAGALALREMRENSVLRMNPIAFLDDNPTKKGLRINNVPVLGDRSLLPQTVEAHAIDLVVIAMPTAPGRIIREIAEACRRVNVAVKTMPGLYAILSGSVKVSAMREVELEDLLRREPVTIDLAQVGQYLGGARVLVTGAGGSIGSELCRQIARFKPARLILFELSEHNLYQIHRELTTNFPTWEIVPLIGDVRDADKVARVFTQENPNVVFHAAAKKHVPLSELNVEEAVACNVFGTRNVINASLQNGVARVVLISTDKAVNPRSVMGASKRVAELLMQDAARKSQCAFMVVRFGNVLGSSGSVVPLFKEQVAAGGPITVMDPEIQRYFMTIQEAVNLIFQAAALGKGGEIFVLDMGEPVKISDLARDVIRLSGFEPGRDIEIIYTGLRAGEKMSEELFRASEQRVVTQHQQIFMAQSKRGDEAKLQHALANLEPLVHTADPECIRAKLREIVPEYEFENTKT